MLFIDAHVHIHNCFNLETFFDSASNNIKTKAAQLGFDNQFIPVLMMAESANMNWFHSLCEYGKGHNPDILENMGCWEIQLLPEESVLKAVHQNSEIYIFNGRQIVTAEGLEVLALVTSNFFSDGLPLKETIELVRRGDGIPVIPWGFGKWWGHRGKIITKLINGPTKPGFFIGDNGGRPWFLPRPVFFNLAETSGIPILPGSDPLPFASENHRAGSLGLFLPGQISDSSPTSGIKDIILNSAGNIRSFGNLENPFRFLRNQIFMQTKKRFTKPKEN